VDVGHVAGDAVAVEVGEAVADLGLGEHLALAGAPLGAGGVAGLHAGLARADAQRARRALITGLRRARLAGAGPVLEDVPLAAVRRVAVAVGPPGLALLQNARAVLADVQRVGRVDAADAARAAVGDLARQVVAGRAAAREARRAGVHRAAPRVADVG